MTSPLVLAGLAAAALFAGFIDAIAGGGGLVTVPALLVATPDPTLALGTNKGQSVFGSLSALVSYARSGHLDRRRALPTFVAASLGSVLGVRLVLALDRAIARPVVVVLLVVVAFSVALRGRGGSQTEVQNATPKIGVRWPKTVASAIGFSLGAYDGFFGPGTGTFLIAANSALFGDDLTRATANAKVSNFASNLAAVVTFALAGRIDVRLVVPMAVAQIVGGWLGARAAVRGGDKLVRSGVLVVSAALVVRILWQIATGS
jgi:hypothetical protein